VAVAEVDRIMGAAIDTLWEKVKGQCAVGYNDFVNYFSGCETGYALKLKNIVTYQNAFTLEALREYMPQYNPPQFFHFLNESHPLYSLLTDYLQ
jgi:predicted transcriptional regulator